jgi:hypothetical protein
VEAVQELLAFGLTPQEAMVAGFGHFPVAGPASYTDDWGAPRPNPVPHTHKGTDIFAPAGTPIRAPYDGIVRYSEEPVGGRAAYLTTADRTEYYMAHVSGYAPGVSSGSRVKQGTIIAFVGDTGNAVGGTPHCHFEIHPQGGAPTNPKPFLDEWLHQALADVDTLLASYRAKASTAVAVAGFLRHFDVADPNLFAAPSAPPSSPVLWASTVNPVGSTATLATSEVASLMNDPGLADVIRSAVRAQQERAVVATFLAPLTPPALAGLFGGAE